MQNRFRVLESPSWLWDKPESLSNLFNEITRYLEVSDRASKLLTDQLQFPMSYWEVNRHELTRNILRHHSLKVPTTLPKNHAIWKF